MATAARILAPSPTSRAGDFVHSAPPTRSPSRARQSAWLGSQGHPQWHRLCHPQVQAQRPSRLWARQADDMPPSEMSLETALELLGVREGATFDEILRAKKSILDTSGGDQELLIQVEAAYDILLMQSLSKRRAGKVVDNSVKFADVRKPRATVPQWVTSALKASPVAAESPAPNELAVQAAIFGALAAWTFLGGLGEVESVGQGGASVPGLQLAVAFGAALYFLRQQNVKLGKASLITFGGLVTGALLGSAVEAWLRVDIFPVLGISSPAVVVSEFVFFALWLTSAYLR